MDESGAQAEYMTLTEAAELLGVSRFKMGRWVKDGLLPSYRSLIDGRQKLVMRDEVLAMRRPRPATPPEIETGKAAA